MANTRSAQKAMRQTERRTANNRAARSAVRTFVKKASLAVTSPSDGASAAETVRQAVKALDKAAKRGIIHPNAAARHKSRLMSRAQALSAAAATAAPSAEAAPTRGRGRAAASSETRSRSRTTRSTSRGSTTTTRRASPKKEG